MKMCGFDSSKNPFRHLGGLEYLRLLGHWKEWDWCATLGTAKTLVMARATGDFGSELLETQGLSEILHGALTEIYWEEGTAYSLSWDILRTLNKFRTLSAPGMLENQGQLRNPEYQGLCNFAISQETQDIYRCTYRLIFSLVQNSSSQFNFDKEKSHINTGLKSKNQWWIWTTNY